MGRMLYYTWWYTESLTHIPVSPTTCSRDAKGNQISLMELNYSYMRIENGSNQETTGLDEFLIIFLYATSFEPFQYFFLEFLYMNSLLIRIASVYA